MQELLTLAPGDRKKRFRVEILAGEWIRIETGRKGNGIKMSWQDYKKMIAFFRCRGFFPLGNGVDDVRPGGLGEYFRDRLKKGSRYASHFAAVMVYIRDAKVVREHPITLRII